MADMKPCPFCGCEATVRTSGCPDFTDTWVECSVCGARAGEIESHGPRPDFSIAAWNRRTPEQEREREALERDHEAMEVLRTGKVGGLTLWQDGKWSCGLSGKVFSDPADAILRRKEG